MTIAQTLVETKVSVTHSMELGGLEPTPGEEWNRLMRYVGLDRAAQAAMAQTVEPPFAQMLAGNRVARAMDEGAMRLNTTFFGRLRDLTQSPARTVQIHPEAMVADVLRKVFNYYPSIRTEAMELIWQQHGKPDELWPQLAPMYVPRPGWRLLLNGRDLSYYGGFDAKVNAGDEVAFFPPGR